MPVKRRDMRNPPFGYTLIEVMFSLVVFMTAITGLVALHAFSSKGVGEAKDHTIAVNIATFFLTELQNEVSSWSEDIEGDFPDAFPESRFPLLRVAYGGLDQWHNLASTLDDFRVGDYLGHSSLDNSNLDSRFCVNYMVSPMEERWPGVTDDSKCRVWKVRVRVSRSRPGQYVSDWNLCEPSKVTARIETSKGDSVVELVAVATREYAK